MLDKIVQVLRLAAVVLLLAFLALLFVGMTVGLIQRHTSCVAPHPTATNFRNIA